MASGRARGPYVRIDLAEPADLLDISALYFAADAWRKAFVIFASANDRLLGTVSPVDAFGGRNVSGHEMWRLPGVNSWENPVTMHSPDLYLDAVERAQAQTNGACGAVRR